jgi:hypothetical protein
MTCAKWIFFAVAAGLAGYDSLAAQTASVASPFKVVRLDPALDAIISIDAKLDILGEHFGLTEGGPVCNLAFGDADNKSLFITACTHLFRVRLKAAGIRPGLQEQIP